MKLPSLRTLTRACSTALLLLVYACAERPWLPWSQAAVVVDRQYLPARTAATPLGEVRQIPEAWTLIVILPDRTLERWSVPAGLYLSVPLHVPVLFLGKQRGVLRHVEEFKVFQRRPEEEDGDPQASLYNYDFFEPLGGILA
jgi:hypothetical protein